MSTEETNSKTYPLFFMGNPLLDMQVTNGEKLLEKYGLKSNDAILAGEKEAGIYDEIVKDYKVTYVAGGAAQNAARAAAYVLPPSSVVYTGCVGTDSLATTLKSANLKEGVESAYLVKEGELTGACAVVITGHDRSLVTTLRASEKFEKGYLESERMRELVEGAKVYYVGGFFLTHGVESALVVAKRAAETGKSFALNLSAPFICQFFKEQLEQILPYADIVIGNESEATAYASAIGLPLSSTPGISPAETVSSEPAPNDPSTSDLITIAKALASHKKINTSRPRYVILTHGAKSTILLSSEKINEPIIVPVIPLDKEKGEEVVDTNGAGDAFAGGFVGALFKGLGVEECVRVGHRMGRMCVGQIGPQFKWPKVNVL